MTSKRSLIQYRKLRKNHKCNVHNYFGWPRPVDSYLLFDTLAVVCFGWLRWVWWGVWVWCEGRRVARAGWVCLGEWGACAGGTATYCILSNSSGYEMPLCYVMCIRSECSSRHCFHWFILCHFFHWWRVVFSELFCDGSMGIPFCLSKLLTCMFSSTHNKDFTIIPQDYCEEGWIIT